MSLNLSNYDISRTVSGSTVVTEPRACNPRCICLYYVFPNNSSAAGKGIGPRVDEKIEGICVLQRVFHVTMVT